MEEWKDYTGKTVDEALATAMLELRVSSDELEYEVIEKETRGFLGLMSKPAKIRVKIKQEEKEAVVSPVSAVKEGPVEKAVTKSVVSASAGIDPENSAKDFLVKVFGAMNINAEIHVSYDETEETVSINLSGEDMGVLIGKRGQTLDSLQYLTSLVVNKNSDDYLKVKLDTENYRERRKETLENLAKNIASKVKRTHKAVSLEPMNPYERRIIHSTLQNDKYVETHSEGDEPYRKVVITPKKGVREYGDRPYSNNRRGRYDNGGVKKYSKKEFHKKYGENTKDYSTDYKKDYAAYLEQKAAAKAAAENAEKESNETAE